MLQDSFRKHRRWWLAALLVVIIPAFVIVGVGSSRDSQRPADMPIGQVGDVVITAGELRRAVDQELMRRTQMGQEATAMDLATDGTLLQIRESLIQRKLIEHHINALDMSFNRTFLADQLKKSPELLGPDGEFDYERWNAWVKDSRINWNALYASAQEDARRMVFSERILAGARVLESELRQQFEERNTVIDLRYLAVEPPIEVAEEDLLLEYSENPARYQNPEERVAAFVAFSLAPEKPATVDEVVSRARAGEDFEELAREFSQGPLRESGGNLGWTTVTDTMPMPRSILNTLAPGEVSDPVQFGSAWYVFKAMDEQITDEGERQIDVREILILAAMDDAERDAVLARAEAFAAQVREAGSLIEAAESADLEVGTSGPFSIRSVDIEGVPAVDVGAFRSSLTSLAEDTVSDVLQGSQNLYVAQITEVREPALRPFEEVEEDVRTAVIAQRKREPAYREAVQALADRVRETATTLEEIPAQFPELADVEIRDIPPFSMGEPDYSSGVFWRIEDVYAAVKDAGPGDLAGPVEDFFGNLYFVEVQEVRPPSEEMWAMEWPAERDGLRESALQLAQNQRAQDYIKFLEEQAYGNVNIRLDDASMMQVLGLLEGPPPAGPIPGAAPTTDFPVSDILIEEAAPGADSAIPTEAPEESAASESAADPAETPES